MTPLWLGKRSSACASPYSHTAVSVIVPGHVPAHRHCAAAHNLGAVHLTYPAAPQPPPLALVLWGCRRGIRTQRHFHVLLIFSVPVPGPAHLRSRSRSSPPHAPSRAAVALSSPLYRHENPAGADRAEAVVLVLVLVLVLAVDAGPGGCPSPHACLAGANPNPNHIPGGGGVVRTGLGAGLPPPAPYLFAAKGCVAGTAPLRMPSLVELRLDLGHNSDMGLLVLRMQAPILSNFSAGVLCEEEVETLWGFSTLLAPVQCLTLDGACSSAPAVAILYSELPRRVGHQPRELKFDSDPDSDAPKRKRKAKAQLKPRKRPSTAQRNGKAKATEPDSDSGGIRVTAKPEKRKGGMFVDKVFYVDAASAPESLDVPPADHRVAYIFDYTQTPELLRDGDTLMTVDAFIKKECQDAWDGPTGTSNNKLAKVVILDPDDIVLCRRSNLTCNSCYKCSLAAEDFLANCQRWSSTDEHHLHVFADTRTAKALESSSVAATASAVKAALCKGTYLDSNVECGGYGILRRFREGPQKGKTYFVGCSNWSGDDSDRMSKIHRFTAIPLNVRESVVVKIFKGEQIDEEDDDTDVLAGTCSQIIHPSHIPSKSICPRTHFSDGVHVTAKLKKHACGAKLSILTPIDPNDLRAVVIPAAGIPHTHPAFPRAKVPALVQQKYDKCIEAAGSIGMTTLRIDKASSTREILGGRLPQQVHPSMINSRKRRDMVQTHRMNKFPNGTDLPGVYHEFSCDQSRAMEDRYIHSVTTQTDENEGTHVIITVNPELAKLALEALWIMVDTTFAVVHGKTNEWKLIIWLNSIDKRIVIGRVWSNRATRSAFVLVWNGIFEAIETITSQKLNFQQLDKETAIVILETLKSGVLENPNNSLQARFRNKAHRDARTREKQNELQSLTGKDAKKLRGQVKAGQQKLKDKDSEIALLRRQLQQLSQPVAGPSSKFIVRDTTPILISDDEADISGPSQMPALSLFPGLRPMTPITEPRSDFDYQAALNSDIMDHTFKSIIRDHPVDSDDEVIASDPYPVYH
ncbi:hypothetical protein K438DRAFT_2000450 [Mycena galopus ATCC 62051]|nr:hypothetical protein K438DRAFT_2000450 [Mycena galopus ATCC 62051]